MTPRYTISQQQVQLSVRQPVRIQRLRVTDDVAAHDHEFYELCLVRSGRGRHRTAAGQETVSAGSLIVVAPGQVHGFAVREPMDVVNLYYLSEWLTGDLSAMWCEPGLIPLFLAQPLYPKLTPAQPVVLALPGQVVVNVLREVEDLERESARASPSPLLLRASLLKLLAQGGRWAPPQVAAAQGLSPAVMTAMASMERAVSSGEPFALDEAAAEAGLSAAHLSRVFRSATGLSPMTYFQRRRVRQAAHLLLDPRLTVTRVAHQLGFADAAHLSRTFRRHYHLSPRAYRATFAADAADAGEDGR